MNDQKHTEVTDAAPITGEHYRVLFKGEPLYTATIVQSEGCWCKIRIDAPLPGKHQDSYTAGDEYKVKHAMYSFELVGD